MKKYVKPEEHNKLFSTSEHEIKFSGQAAPLKKGRPKLPTLEVPESTATYASVALKKLYTPTRKRLAVEFETPTIATSTNTNSQIITPELAINQRSNTTTELP